MEQRVAKLLKRLAEVEESLGGGGAYQDPQAYRKLTKEHAYLTDVKSVWENLAQARHAFNENREMLKLEKDAEFAQVLRDDMALLEKKMEELQDKVERLLVPPDPNDDRNTIMELRAGTGGDEAALFVGDCVRMYLLYAASKGWKTELLSCAPSEMGGFKEYIMVVSGPGVYRHLRHEGGTHRVQRVPATEAQGRVHTSAITIAVLLEPDEEEDFNLDDKDLRVDTYRSSGAGGQHVNTTDSAVRVTHLPTGLVAYCQEEKSQHKNKDKAMRLLKALIVEQERRKKQAEIDSNRAIQVGSGDRSERIRTYNFSQNRVTDHRIDLTIYSLSYVLDGVLDPLIQPLILDHHRRRLEAV